MAVGSVGQVFISLWVTGGAESDYDELERVQAIFIEANPKFVSMAIVAKVVTDATANEIAKRRGVALVKRFSTNIQASAVAIPVPGIGGTVARSFTAAFNLMSGAKYPNKVFAEVVEATEWLKSLTLDGVKIGDSRQLASEIESFMKSFAR